MHMHTHGITHTCYAYGSLYALHIQKAYVYSDTHMKMCTAHMESFLRIHADNVR